MDRLAIDVLRSTREPPIIRIKTIHVCLPTETGCHPNLNSVFFQHKGDYEIDKHRVAVHMLKWHKGPIIDLSSNSLNQALLMMHNHMNLKKLVLSIKHALKEEMDEQSFANFVSKMRQLIPRMERICGYSPKKVAKQT